MGFLLNVLKAIYAPAVKQSLESIKKDEPEMDTTIDPLEQYDDEMKNLIKQWKKDLKSKDPEVVQNARRWLRIFDIPIPEGAP